MNILILTGKFGLGHYSVANTLVQKIQNSSIPATTTVCDVLKYIFPNFGDAVYDCYSLLVNKGSALFNLYYKMTEKNTTNHVNAFYRASFRRLVEQTAPDVIISTLPMGSQMVSDYKMRTGSKIPLVTCITDISCHCEWINPKTDFYLVASKRQKSILAQKGIAAKSIFITGIPVKEQFSLSEGGAESSQKQLLVMGGGLGILPRRKGFYEKLSAMENVRTTIILGNNHSLYEKLWGKYENIEVVGFTDKVYEYMQNADLIISKPGGITLFESIFSNLPILAINPVLQQEVKNASFIEQHKIGKVLWEKPKSLEGEIESMLYDSGRLGRYRENMEKIKNNIEEDTICRILSKLQGVCA